MGRKGKSPQEKKQDSYKRDRYVELDASHAFRKNWPKKKARAEQAYRRASSQMLNAVTKEPETADIAADGLKSLKRAAVVKTGKMRLREWLDRHQRERIMRAIRYRFGSIEHVMTLAGRAKAAEFLKSVMHRGGKQESRLFASAFREVWLPRPQGNSDTVVEFGAGHSWRNRDGLERVFEEYPKLKREFEEWLRLESD